MYIFFLRGMRKEEKEEPFVIKFYFFRFYGKNIQNYLEKSPPLVYFCTQIVQFYIIKMKKSIYAAPEVELLEFAVEHGFATSNVGGSSNEEMDEDNEGNPIW